MLQIQEKIGQVNLLQMAICLFVYFGLFVPLENLLLIWRSHHYRWSATNFDLCSALMPIEQWGFFSMPHLLWHGASIYNGHHRGPVTLNQLPSVEQVSCHYLFLRLMSVAWDSNTQSSACGANALTTCATAVVIKIWIVYTVQRVACLILKFPKRIIFFKNR